MGLSTKSYGLHNFARIIYSTIKKTTRTKFPNSYKEENVTK